MNKWYVVADAGEHAHPDKDIWTISHHPKDTGWETDSGCDGYGLRKAEAQELADAANGQQCNQEQLLQQLKEANCIIASLVRVILPFVDAVTYRNNIYTFNLNKITTEDYKRAYIEYYSIITKAKTELKDR